MKLILKHTIDTLGEEGDIVKVKEGYGRNYLIPHGKAVLATDANITALEKERATIEDRKLSLRSDAEALAKRIAAITVTIAQRAGEENRLFGSVTSSDIAQKMAAAGIEIDKKKIVLDEPIKTIGTRMVPIKLGYHFNAEVKVEVVPLTAE